ncbi:hypothetical protein DSO57_1007656 [Entomophthora muscae]|uniref:Uncharacterized protein n=1 Tax=Entomophthora muscae TaxID=34485 RepID=A0ACC2T733_9FUNG|nr:hypothetical protein DSO57_1007656 [Entomophthora muscae]
MKEDIAYWVPTANNQTCCIKLCSDMIIPHKVQQTVFLYYAKHLNQSRIKITPDNNSKKLLVKLVHTETILALLDLFKEVTPDVEAAKATFLNKFKELDVHQDSKVMMIKGDYQDYMYFNLVISKPNEQAILDLGAPGAIDSSYPVKKLKSAPGLTYHNSSEIMAPQSAKLFLAMDLISRYWQIDLPPADQEKCAIIISQRLF